MGFTGPEGFVYALKLGQFGSHRKKLLDAATWLPNHVERAERLGAALGPTLVQLPPGWRRDAGRLEAFLSVAPRSMRWAVELREPSWLNDDVFEILRRYDAALCIHDMVPGHPWIRTANWTYVRYHGPYASNRKYRGRYRPSRLEPGANILNEWLQQGDDVYAYFNNDYDGDAVRDAQWLAGRLPRRHTLDRSKAPSAATYPSSPYAPRRTWQHLDHVGMFIRRTAWSEVRDTGDGLLQLGFFPYKRGGQVYGFARDRSRAGCSTIRSGKACDSR